MPEVLLFTKPDCQKCDWVKERLPEGVEMQILDATTTDGLAEAAFYEIIEEPFPVLVVDEEVVTGAIQIVDRLKSLCGN